VLLARDWLDEFDEHHFGFIRIGRRLIALHDGAEIPCGIDDFLPVPFS
jgi:hypothetical protein